MISIVSLAWNKLDLTREFLERLKKYTDIEHELVFSDNGSIEPIIQLVKELYPNAKLIEYKENIGCPATRNPSMKEVAGDIVFWLDNDTMVEKDWYKPFLEPLKEDEVGIVGVDGRRVKNPFDASVPWNFNYTSPFCDWFVGYAVAFKKKAYKEIPDWNLKVNMDDVDLGMGIKANGFQAYTLKQKPNLNHLGSQTALSVRPDTDRERDILRRWWGYWEQYKDSLEDYK